MIENNSLEYAGFWRRVVAYLIDAALLGIVALIVMGIFIPPVVLFGSAPGIYFAVMIGLFAIYVIPPVLVIYCWYRWQATPGKMLFSMKIVDAQSGGKPSVGQCVGRYFSYILSSLLFCLGFFWVAFDPRKQGFHDKLASTVVVRQKAAPVLFSEAGTAQQGPEYAARRDAQSQFQAPQEPAG